MEELLRSYGPWILLAAVFLTMHWFGKGCGSHRHGDDGEEKPGRPGGVQGPDERPGGSRRCH